MPKLPDRTALGASRLGANTPDVRVGTPDYGILSVGTQSLERGFQKVAQGGQQLAQGFMDAARSNEEQENYDVQKKLLDWKLETEMDLENAKREMPVGGENFSGSWGERYKERATSFVGEKDANIPPRLRGKVGMEMKRHEVSLSERAQRMEMAERDKNNIEGLNASASAVLSQVEADPARKDEMFEEGRKLILAAPIPPADRHRLLQKFDKEVNKTAAVSRLMKAQSKEEYDALQRDLAPHMPDKPTPISAMPEVNSGNVLSSAQSFFLSKGLQPHQAAALAGNMRWESGGNPHLVNPNDNQKNSPRSPHSIGIGQWNDRVPALIAFARKSGVDVPEGNLRDVGYARAVAKSIPLAVQLEFAWNELNTTERRSFDKIMAARNLREATEGAIGYHRPAGWTRNNPSMGHGFSNRLGLASQALGIKASTGEVPAAKEASDGPVDYDSGGMPGPSADAASYAGPYASLSLVERKAIWGQAQTQWNKQLSEIKGAIDKQAAVATEGLPPPQHVIDTIDAKVRAAKDPALSAHYGAMLGKLAMTQQLSKAPPGPAEDFARRMREDGERNGATPEQLDAIKHAEKTAAGVRKQVNENPVGWAHKAGIEVPLADGPPADLAPGQRDKWQMPVRKAKIKQLDFRAPDIDAQLADRFEVSKGIARYYGQPFIGFTPTERDGLKDSLKVGGPNMLTIMGKIAAQAQIAGVDPSLVMKEITKDAPEVAHIGTMIAEGSESPIITTAAKALSWKNQQGQKFDSTIDKSATKPDLAEYADVLSSDPTKVDNVKHLANLVYEYEARLNGEQSFNQTRYKDVVARILGQTTGADGVKYGGVGYANSSWFDGKSSNAVMVPPGVRSDKFDDMLGALRASDLAKTGMPRGKDGEPLTMGEIRGATWVSIGPGRYWLQKSRSENGERQLALDEGGQPFVMDIRPVLGSVRQRRPDIFAGFDSMTMTVPPKTADPALPKAWTGEQPEGANPVTNLQPEADPAMVSP